MKEMRIRIIDAVRNLEDIADLKNKLLVFERILTLVKEIKKFKNIPRRDLKYVYNILIGLTDGFVYFTDKEINKEVFRLIEPLKNIKLDLADYARNIDFRTPLGKSYLDLDPDHFLSLAKFQGCGKVIQNLINLKFDDSTKIKWADAIISYIECHRNHINKRDWKAQLEDLKSFGGLAEKQKIALSSTSSFVNKETEKFVRSITSFENKFLDVNTDFGLVITPVIITGYFNKFIEAELEKLNYIVNSFATHYAVIHNGKCFGIHTKLVEKSDKKVKKDETEFKLLEIIRRRTKGNLYYAVGSPIYQAPHYYWLCFEWVSETSKIKARMWGFSSE